MEPAVSLDVPSLDLLEQISKFFGIDRHGHLARTAVSPLNTNGIAGARSPVILGARSPVLLGARSPVLLGAFGPLFIGETDWNARGGGGLEAPGGRRGIAAPGTWNVYCN